MINSLSGNWRYSIDDKADFALPGFDDSAWATMSIPRNWFLGGLDHHGVVWFRYGFEYRPSAERPFCDLHFDGVDYFCDVYLNGKLLGQHEGYFDPFAFDATEALTPGKNVLAVRVDSPYETPGPQGWHTHKKLLKGVLNHHDMRPGGGWDNVGQSFNTGGIWNRVFLESHGAVTVETVLLQAQLETAPPTLRAEIRVKNRSSKLESNLRVECVPENFQGQSYSAEITAEIPGGESVHHVEIKAPNAQRWQPWDRGFQHLYRVSVKLMDSDYTTLFGFRTVRVDEKFNWFVNGERYFLRGSNHLPSQWLSELVFPEIAFEKGHPFGGRDDPAPFTDDVGLMKQANLNIIRIHAHALPPEFHEACDRAGVMVWQDFPMQWGYCDEPAFHAEAERQERAMVEMLYNHPSIVAWCMHNESPWSATWMEETFDPSHNRLLDEHLEKTIRELDPTRHVHKNSGTGDGHAYPGWYFSHWREFVNAPGGPFCTEYGAQGLPVKESMLKTFPEWGEDAGYAGLMEFKAWLESHKQISLATQLLVKLGTPVYSLAERFKWKKLRSWMAGEGIKVERSIYRMLPKRGDLSARLQHDRDVWESWRFHNFQPSESFEPGRIDTGKSLDEYIANSQFYQANIVQFATESYRRVKFSQVSGIFHFAFSDPWPAITWSVVDYWRKPKLAFDALRWAMQPVLPTLGLPLYVDAGKTVVATLMVVNDLAEAFSGAKVNWSIENSESKAVTGEWLVNVPVNDVSASKAVSLPFAKAGDYKVSVQIHARDGKLLGENIYNVKAA
ncbi:MAG: sugar-binding domain-containing protein [Anaerolineales bacterium]